MTDRGKLVCWDCDELASWIDEPLPKSAASCDYWCDKHCSIQKENYTRFNIKQELVTLLDGSQIWYPSCKMSDGTWKGWPFVGTEIMLWGLIGPRSNVKEKYTRNDKKWWKFWK